MKHFLAVLFCASAFAQATINAPAVTLDASATTATLKWMGKLAASKPTELVGGITDIATSVTVKNASQIGANAVISIDDEHLAVTAKNGNVLTVTRAANGTTAAAHPTGSEVTEMRFKTLNQFGKGIIVDVLRRIQEAAETEIGTAAAVNAAKAKAAQGVK